MYENEDFNLEELEEPNYYYQVQMFMSTICLTIPQAIEGITDPSFHHEENFKGNDLMRCKSEAENYYREQLEALEREGKFRLPFATPQDFKLGENATFSITLYFVHSYPSGEEHLFPILGEDDETLEEGREIENEVFKALGLL